jgi:hypothetical protein
METKAVANLKPSRFEPYCEWRTEEGRDVLELHLQGIISQPLVRESHLCSLRETQSLTQIS